MAAFQKIQSRFLPRFDNFKNVYDLNRLMSIHPAQCGHIIRLKQIPRYCFEKLLLVLQNSQLEKIVLANCFTNPVFTLKVLEAIKSNYKLQKIHLDLQQNGYNEDCLKIFVDLISKRVVKSFEAFYNMTEESVEILLENVVRYGVKLKILNLSGAVLSEQSIHYLEELLQNNKISEILRLTDCKGIAGASLTSEDKKQLQTAAKKIVGGVKIYWFDFVGHVDIDRHHRGNLEFLSIDGVKFNRKTGRKEVLVRILVRDATEQLWQALKPGSKRKQTTIHIDTKQQRVLSAEDETSLSDTFQSNTAIHKQSTDSRKTSATHKQVNKKNKNRYGNRGKSGRHSGGDEGACSSQSFNPFGRQHYEEPSTSYNKAVPYDRHGGVTVPETSNPPSVPRFPPHHQGPIPEPSNAQMRMPNPHGFSSNYADPRTDFGNMYAALDDVEASSRATQGPSSFFSSYVGTHGNSATGNVSGQPNVNRTSGNFSVRHQIRMQNPPPTYHPRSRQHAAIVDNFRNYQPGPPQHMEYCQRMQRMQIPASQASSSNSTPDRATSCGIQRNHNQPRLQQIQQTARFPIDNPPLNPGLYQGGTASPMTIPNRTVPHHSMAVSWPQGSDPNIHEQKGNRSNSTSSTGITIQQIHHHHHHYGSGMPPGSQNSTDARPPEGIEYDVFDQNRPRHPTAVTLPEHDRQQRGAAQAMADVYNDDESAFPLHHR